MDPHLLKSIAFFSSDCKFNKMLYSPEIFQKAAKYDMVTRISEHVIKLVNICTFGLNYIFPAIYVWIAFSKHSPAQIIARGTYNYEQNHGWLVSLPVNAILSLETSFLSNVYTATYGICMLSVANGIIVLYLWSAYLYMHVSTESHTKSN